MHTYIHIYMCMYIHTYNGFPPRANTSHQCTDRGLPVTACMARHMRVPFTHARALSRICRTESIVTMMRLLSGHVTLVRASRMSRRGICVILRGSAAALRAKSRSVAVSYRGRRFGVPGNVCVPVGVRVFCRGPSELR